LHHAAPREPSGGAEGSRFDHEPEPTGILGAITRRGPFYTLRFRQYRLIWWGHVATGLATWMDQVARGWLLYELTDSPLQLGLVRAVGMTRRQVRRMVRFEAALVALFGATLGVGLGLLFGYGVVGALPATFVSTFSVPVPSILVMVLVAAIAGVVAALLPARRAARLDVLDAISH